MILLSHPTGNEFVRQALIAFEEAGMLGEFWTTLNWDTNGLVHRLLPKELRQLLARRSYPASVQSRIHTVPFREAVRLTTGAFDLDSVSSQLDKKVAARLRKIDHCDIVYAYEDSALETFQAATERGIPRVYDLPIGYWRTAQRIFAEEKEREPEWAVTLTGTKDSAEKLARKDEELGLAQHVIVASTFTKNTLADFDHDTRLTLSTSLPAGETHVRSTAVREGKRLVIDVIPYGAPVPVSPQIRKPAGRLKVLFAGSLGQRKGLSYLLSAIGMLKNSVDLTLLGRKAASDCQPLDAAVRKYRWIPTLPHNRVLQEMHEHDLLVFPSLFEGFGLVILEAMAQGTPVITTDHTAGPDIIENGVDGFIVPIRSAEAIAEKIDILAGDSARLMTMKSAAQQKAAANPWKIYRQRLVEMAREVIAGKMSTS